MASGGASSPSHGGQPNEGHVTSYPSFGDPNFEGVPSTTSNAISKQDVTCTVCLDRLKDPRLLPCLHAYCKRCLDGILHQSLEKRKIVCPQCRSNHAVPSSGVGAFPSDMLLESALEFYSLKDEPKKAAVACNMCTENDPATMYCPTCGKFLCAFCSKAHGRMLEYRDHKVVALDKLDSEAMKQFERPHHCSNHSGEPLKLYCETCKSLICRDCTIVDHRNHDFGFVKTIRPKIVNAIGELMQAVKMKQQELEAHLALVKDVEKGQDAHSTALMAEINMAFDSYIKMLESRRKHLLANVAETRMANLKQIWGQKEFLEVTLATLTSVLHYSERLCHCPSDTHMLAMSTKASEGLENLQKTEWTPESDLKLSPPLAFEGAKESSLTAAGDLNPMSANVSIVKAPNLPKLGRDSQRKEEMVIKVGTKFGCLPVIIPSATIEVIMKTLTISHKHRHSGYRTSQHQHANVPCTVKYTGNSLWTISFLPKCDGEYSISVIGNGKFLLTHKLSMYAITL